MKKSIHLAAALSSLVVSVSAIGQGTLAPPGPPSQTMLTLSQVEPRTPISSLPITITNSGSYFLTTNLTGVSGSNGITILANNVTIDLRGFTLFGVTGAQSGIWVPGGTTSLTLKDGTVRDWPFSGVDADDGFDAQFSQVNVIANGADGLRPGTDAIIRHCIADGNGDDGFGGGQAGYECTFDGCTAQGNGNDGFNLRGRCRVANCDANDNFVDGFALGFENTANNCTAGFNAQNGINMEFTGCVAANCVCDDNDVFGFLVGDHCLLENCAATYNASDGINAWSGTTVQSSVAGFNEGHGITTANDCTLSGCAADTNSTDNIVTGTGCTLDHCSAGYSTTASGFVLGSGNTLDSSSAPGNAINGIDASDRTTIRNCTTSFNGNAGVHIGVLDTVSGCSCVNNGRYGILEDNNGDSIMLQNNCSYNGTLAYSGSITAGAGICVTNSAGCRIEGNTVNFNFAGLVVAPTNTAFILRNSADANIETNFNFGGGNLWGPIVNGAAGGDISAIANSSHPDANIVY